MCVSVYPITFLYRQFLELYIKDILLKFDEKFDAKKKSYCQHDLYNLWHALLPIIRENTSEFPAEFGEQTFCDVLIATDAYIAEFSAADHGSLSFRYPDDKGHNKNFFPNEIPIDLINLRDRIDELANILFLVERTLADLQTLKSELYNDFL